MTRPRIYSIYRKTKTQILNISTSFILVATSLGGALPVIFPGQAFAVGLTPTITNGYFALDKTGFNVGFDVSGFQNVDTVKVKLYKGGDLLVANTGKQPLFNLIDNAAGQSISSPFVLPVSGSADTYWSFGSHNWTANDEPTKAIVTIKADNGDVSLPILGYTHNVYAGSPSVNFADLVAPNAPANTHFLTDKLVSLPCGSTVNSIYNNKLQFTWDTGSSNSDSYRTLITFPDGQTKWAYTGSRNVWMGNVVKYNYDNGFGEHGNGVYSYEVQALNKSSNQWSDMAAACTLAYDTHIPTAHLVAAPDNGAPVNGTLTIQASTEDNVALKSLFVDVRSQDGSTWKAGCTGTTAYAPDRKTATLTCTVNTAGLTDGTTYMLRAHASDYAGYGNVNADAVRYFTIDRTAPSAPSLASPGNTSLVTDNTPAFSWNGSNDTYRYQIQVSTSSDLRADGAFKSLVEQINPSTNSYTFKAPLFSNLADGTYYWHVRARDLADNWSAYSPIWFFTVDTTAPDVAITNPAGGNVVSFAKDGTLEVRGTVTDAHASHYYLKITGPNGYHTGPLTVNSSTSFTDKDLYSWNLDGLESGDYVIDLEARDALGNKDAGSTQKIHVTVDNTAPAAPTLVSPDDNAVVNGASITQAWLDAASDIDHYVYESYKDASASQLRWHEEFNSSITSKTATNVAETTYWWRVKAVDTAGNESGWSELRKITVDNTAPSAPVATPGQGSYEGTQFVSLTSSDANGTPDIHYTTDGSTPSDTNGTLYIGAFTVSTTETLKAIAYDTAGNASAVLTADYTITAPTPPTLPGGFGGDALSFTPAALAFGAPQTPGLQGSQSPQDNTATPDQAVLGASTTKDDSGNKDTDGHVKGASTDKVENATDKKSGNFLGLGWWWILVLLAVIGIALAIMRRPAEDEAF